MGGRRCLGPSTGAHEAVELLDGDSRLSRQAAEGGDVLNTRSSTPSAAWMRKSSGHRRGDDRLTHTNRPSEQGFWASRRGRNGGGRCGGVAL